MLILLRQIYPQSWLSASTRTDSHQPLCPTNRTATSPCLYCKRTVPAQRGTCEVDGKEMKITIGQAGN